jgi:hypothetical protein
MRGFAITVDAKAKEAEVNVAYAKTYAEAFTAEVGAFRAKTDSLSLQSTNATNAFKSLIEGYMAGIGAQQASVSADAEWAKLDVAKWNSDSTLSIQQAKIIVDAMQHATDQKLAQLKAVADVNGELAKGAMSSINAIVQATSTAAAS